jgi:hypothetical protein
MAPERAERRYQKSNGGADTPIDHRLESPEGVRAMRWRRLVTSLGSLAMLMLAGGAHWKPS